MRFKSLCVLVLLCGLFPAKASADNRFIVRTTLSQSLLQEACNPPLPLLPPICTVVGGLGDPLGQVFLITSPLDLGDLLNLAGNPLAIVDAEVDQLLNLLPVGALNTLPSTSPDYLTSLMSDRTPVDYPNSGGTVWNSYANQPAAQIVRVSDAQSQFGVTGSGIVADIDTGVDPTHPALQGVLMPGYDFTRNQPGGSEMTDFTGTPPSGSTSNTAVVNQSTAAVLDQSTAAVLDCNGISPCQYAAFGHGTMVMGVIHLVAPTAELMPLKTFKSDGTGFLSDILRAVYYAVGNGANVINMSFDTETNSRELRKALNYANQNGTISVASAGNEGQSAPPLTVYPAEWQYLVMGVASVGSTTATDSTPSSFSNFGNAIVWVAAPGEAIVSTYPFGTYAAGWGTSFSAPFVSGGAALLLSRQTHVNEAQAARAVAHAVPVGTQMGHGRLDLVQTLGAVPTAPGSDPPPAGSINSPSGNMVILAGQSVFFSGSGADPDGEITAYSWSFPGGNLASSNVATPGNVTFPTPGIFVVTFTVADDAGVTDPTPPTSTIIVLP